jgi:hypothetical protein
MPCGSVIGAGLDGIVAGPIPVLFAAGVAAGRFARVEQRHAGRFGLLLHAGQSWASPV